MKAIRKPGKQETAKWGAGELATQGLQVGRPLPWAPLVRRAEDCPPYLLVPARRAECLSNVILSLGIDYQRLDLIVRDSEMVVERDRATRK
jgi:hypothetical protein